MSAFDKVIGYENIKSELIMICDMIKNIEVYSELGATLPRGVLLEGDPGLGKTLMSKCFIEESGVPAYTVRKTKSNGDFISEITDAFEKAKENAPAIVFLDDMDKFANEDNAHRDAEEYVTIQACIDDACGTDVFVIATVNDHYKLPKSLTRAGRFDIVFDFSCPKLADATKIIEYYLSGKKVSSEINIDDISKMFSYSSCAELENYINYAAILAAGARKKSIEMDDLVKSILKNEYDSENVNLDVDEEEKSAVALHEAGHAVVCEILQPGSVGLVSILLKDEDRIGGVMHRCVEIKSRPIDVLINLGGKAAVELYYAEHVANGCHSDLHKAYYNIKCGIAGSATKGMSFLSEDDISPFHQFRQEVATQAELESYMLKAKDILLKNRDFLEKLQAELLEKNTLLASDVQRIKSECVITEVAV